MDERTGLKPDNSHSLPPTGPAAAEPVAANEPLAADPVEAAISVGELLRAAREKAAMSQGDVASRLRMGLKQVRALEQNDFATLPKGTFLRGFIRNFAKEVGVKPDQALGLLEGAHREAAAITASPVVVPSQQNIKLTAPGGELATPRARLLIAAAIALFFVAAFWYWWEEVRPHLAEGGRPKAVATSSATSSATGSSTGSTSGIATSVQIPVPAPPSNASAADVGVLPETSSEPAPVQPSPVVPAVSPVAEPSEVAKSVTRPVLVAGNGQLGFTFSGDSWVEVADGNGKVVLSRKFKGGEAEEVVGRLPLTVVIGNAQATRMAHNGKEVDLVPHTRVSVARVMVK